MNAAQLRAAARARAQRWLRDRGYLVERLTPDELRYMTSWSDAPIPAGQPVPQRDDPRLVALRRRYDELDWPVTAHSRWSDRSFVDFARFRGDSLYIWHYRESPRVSALKYFMFLRYVEERDHKGWLDALGEDGAFGCWTFEFPGRRPVSRDLLDSVNELTFLDRHLQLSGWDGLRALDIGAGYGRLAHRAAQALPGLRDWCCADAVAESTYLCEHYLQYRGVVPPARVVELPDVPSLAPGAFDLAVNAHVFSECPREAVRWWAEQLARLGVNWLFVVPNEADGFFTHEADGSRRDYREVLEQGGYRLVVDEPAFADPAVRELLRVHDRHCLFERDRP
ncbi:MAG: putative sugar O-methyltransferase [Acidimicrobiia bacterium]|nr:putative sugar O-methyltransferase [Acidimicrobiia bacterium]MBV9041289.1 putative sugar O-methyltransferase [Acidimicrobiia bacterium]